MERLALLALSRDSQFAAVRAARTMLVTLALAIGLSMMEPRDTSPLSDRR